MRKPITVLAAAVVLATSMVIADTAPSTRPAAGSPLSFTMKKLDGTDQPLSKYAGKVVLMVNTASKCGLAPQLETLEALNKKYAGQGLAVAGFASDNFKNQEFATSEETAEYCSAKGVTFDMYSKVNVIGDDKTPLFKLLTTTSANGITPGEIKWNFEKFLIARDGSIVARFPSRTKPDSPEVIKAIETELAKPAK
jgi:glutathione peroxidase